MLVVGSTSPLSASDEALRARLVGLGLDVTLKTAPAAVTSDAYGKAVAVVSESVSSADVTNKLLGVQTPVVTLEPSIMDDLGMTGPTFGTDYGDAQSQTHLTISTAARGHPIAAGLSGLVQVASPGNKFVWGAPGPEATRIATIAGQGGLAPIFCYEEGATMVGGVVASGRRVGFFPGGTTPAALTANGWALFDGAIRWATGRHLLLVVGAWPLSTADAALRSRLEQQHGYVVETLLGPDTTTASATGKVEIVISESVSSPDVGSKFRSVLVPVLSLEPALWDSPDLGMVGPTWLVDHGDLEGQTQVVVVDPAHPLAGGLPSGSVTVTVTPQKVLWGKPTSSAVKAAALAGDPSKYTIFGYETGAAMVGLSAPARRVGWFAGKDSPSAFNATAWPLFDAAVRWSAGPTALLVVGALPLSPSDALLRDRLVAPLGFKVEVARAVDSQTSQATGKAIVVVSESAISTDVNTKFRDVATPVVSMEPEIYDDLGMTAAGWGSEIGDVQNQQDVNILDATHPLADGLPLGLTRITTAPQKLVWGKPAASAAKVASIAGQATQIAIFGYEKGAAMVGLAAPGRRVGFPAGRDTPLVLNTAGLSLFDAAIRWATGQATTKTSACVGMPDGTSCSNGNACDGAETCQGGVCRSASAPVCSDGNPCTSDLCDAVLGCRFPALPAATSCSNGDACDGAETCSAQGLRQSGAPITCDDSNLCTANSCNPATGACSNPPLPSGSSCGAGLFCNASGTCNLLPGTTANTVELLSYEASGYRYQILPAMATPPAGFAGATEPPGFADGAAAFGSGGGVCPLRTTARTFWPASTQLVARRSVVVPSGMTSVRVMASVDNNLTVYWDGAQIGTAAHSGCPIRDEFRIDVSAASPGVHLLTLHAVDLGADSFLDVRVIGECAGGGGCGTEGLVSGNHNVTLMDAPREQGLSVGGAQGIVGTATRGSPVPRGVTSHNGSFVDNLRFSHVHEATDYKAAGTTAADAQVGRLPELEIHRYHRPRAAGIWSSFGPGVCSNFDTKLELHELGFEGQPNVILFEPERDHDALTFVELSPEDGDALDDGLFHDRATREWKSIELLDAANQRTSVHALAVTAVLLAHTGEKYKFEVITTGLGAPGDRQARLVRIEDRNGEAISIAYAYPAGATTADLGGDRTRLWQIQSVTDAYGLSAAFSYEPLQVGGMWAVNRIDLPNGGALEYEYRVANLANVGPFLERVVHPDGTLSSFTLSFDAGSQLVVIGYDDSAAGTSQVRKSVYVTTATFMSPSGAVSQAPNLVRKIVNGDGETVYQNFEDPADSRITYLYEGGSLLTKLQLNAAGYPESFWRATAPFAPGNDPRSFTFERLESYQANEDQMLTQRVDALGRIETLVRDPGTRAVKQVALDFDPPGSASIIDYNQFREPTHTEDRLDRVVDRTYDGAGNLRFVTAAPGTPEAATWESRYNSRGQLIASFDANGNRTDYAYHPSGRLASILEPADVSGGLRPTRSFTYDSAGRLATAVDPEGRTITYVHDLRNRLREVHHPDLSSETFTYGTGAVANLLVAQTDRNGNVTAYEYDLTKRLRATILAAGTAAEVRDALEYVPGTWLVSAEVRRGERKIYQRDGRNRVVAATTLLPGGQSLTTQTIWDGVAVDRVAKQIDAYGRATFAVYDDNDRISRTVRELVPGGVPSGADLLTLARDPAPNPPYVIEETVLDSMGQVRTRIDGRGVRTSFAYDERGRQISTTEAFGTAEAATTVTEHDPQGNVLRVLHPRTFTEGAVFATEYAYTGRNLRRLERVAAGTPDQAVTTTTFTLTGKPLTTTDARGNTTTYEYDACCDRLRRIIDPTGAATVNTYDPHGNVVSVVDPNGNTTTYAFDGLHRRTSETNGELETTVTTYDDDLSDGVGLDGAFPAYFAGLGFVPGRDGAAVMRTNALGERQVTIQDGLGRSLRRVDANGHAANTTYDQVMGGLVETARFDPLGHARRSRTDGAGRVRESIDAEGQVSRAFFDASGNRVSSRDANQVGEDCAFDPRGRSTYCQDTRGDARQSVFDAHGNLVTAFDGLLVPTTCDFDARDRRRSCTDRNGNTTTWSYDANSNLETQTDAEGGVTRYEYDSRNLRTEEHFPPDDGTDVKVMTYDPGRRLLTRTDQAGDTVTFHYDQANRLTRRQYPDLLDDLLAYDDASRLTSAISQRYTTTVTRAYDPDGRITHEDQTVFGVTRAVGFGYDAADRKTSITYPDATVVTRGYTDRNQLRTVNRGAALLATRAYDSGMRLATTALGNGLAETRTYRAGDNLLESLDVPGVHALGYTYDANKRKRLEQATTNPAESQTFDYDHEDRLTSWSRGGTASTQSWNLTPVGDWDDTTRDGVSEDRSHNRVHEITSIGATPVTHDPKGNLTQDHLGNVFAWDFDNRLKQAQRSGNPAVTYKYDALGRRLGKTVGGTNTTFVYDGDQVVAEYEGAGLARGYVYGSGIDEPLALVTAAGTYFYTQNHLDSVEALTDTAGVVVERYRYDAYGARQVLDAAGLPRAASLFGNPVGFTGRYHDDAVGLVDFRSRLYVPLTGRFASRDANYIDGPSLYVAYFVPNSTDPTGALVRNPLGRLLEALSSIGTAGLSYGEPAILGLGCPFDIDLQAAAPSPPPAPQPPRPNPQPTPTTRCEPSKETCCSERERGDANGYCPCDSRYKGSAPCTSGQGGIVAPGAGSPGSGSGGGAGGGSAGGGGGSSPPPDPFGGCEGRCSDLTPSNPPVSGWTACDDIKACHQDCCDEKWGGGANPNWYECNGIAEAKFKICKDTSPGKVWNRASLGAPSPTAFGVGIGAIAIGAALFLVPELIIPVAVLAF